MTQGKAVKEATLELLRAAKLFKIKHDKQRPHSGKSSPSSSPGSPKASLMD